MKRQTLLKSTLCLLMALLCNVAWAQTRTDGPIVTFTNVQKDGTPTFTLYINEKGELAASSDNAASLGAKAKFRATLQDNGKYTFYNEEKGLYMIWRGKSAGYNGDKGVLAEYNATYCDWSVNQSTNLELGYLFVSKRNDGTSDGSLVIMKATGAFDAYGNTEGWHDNYSNLYRIDIVELAPRTTDFVYNVTDGTYAGSGWCMSWASNDAAKPNLTISVDVNNVNGSQANGIGLRPGTAGSATYTVTAGCTMLSLSFEAKGTNNHKISINGVEKAVGTKWKRFVIHNINAATAEFILKGDNDNDCLLRNVRFVTPALPLRAEVEGSWADNPNTHFGRVTATAGNNVTTMNLTTDHEETTHMLYGGGIHEIDFTRAYRGFEFQGFFLGGDNLGKSFTLTEEQEANITEQNPLVAKFTATDEVTLFYDDDEFSYRIPTIATTSTGRLIAVSDYRHSLDDIGRYNYGTATPGIDLVIRTSDDNGKTWSETKTIAKGSCVRGTDDCAYGDAAIAVVGQKVLVMGAAGDVMFGDGNATAHNRTVRILSEDNGETWSQPKDISETLFIGNDATIPNSFSTFFGSGRLAVDVTFVGTPEKPRIYGAMLLRKEGSKGVYVIYTDDLGLTWKTLGGSVDPIATSNVDEPKVEILPSGKILLSIRRQGGGGRIFNVFTYGTEEGDPAKGTGTWDTNVNGCGNDGSNSTNGEIYCIDAKKPDGTAVKLLLQSQPKGGSSMYDRRDVTIWYKEVDNTDYTSEQIASNWIQGLQVSTQQSAYSAMTLQEDGKIAFFFEEAPCFGDDQGKGYCMVYLPLTIEGITKGNYFSPTTDLNATQTISVVLTDAQGNEYRDQVESTIAGVAAALATKYPFITLGDNAALESDGTNFTYTNTVTLPFKVSNENGTYWHNIYIPTYGNPGRYPVYFYATSNTDEIVKTTKESCIYGASQYNTKDHENKMSWAVYSVGNAFTFKFKNKETQKYIKVTTSASGSSKNVEYGNELEATAFDIKNKTNSNHKGDYIIMHGEAHLSVCSSDNDDYLTFYKGDEHYGSTVKIVEAPDFVALIAEANAVLNLFGDGLGQYSNISEENLTAINAAKSAMEDAGSVRLNILNEYIGYTSKTDGGTLNLPETGKFYYIQSANTNQYLSNIKSNTLTTTAQKSVNNIFYFESDGENTYLVAYENGHYVTNPWNIGVGEVIIKGTEKYKQTKSFVEGQVGKYALKYFADNGSAYYFTASGTSTNAKQDKSHNEAQWNLEPVTELPLAIHSSGKSTYSAPVDLKIPDNVTVYYAKRNDGETIRMAPLFDVIPANTGVVVVGAGETTVNFPITTGVTQLENNLLKPVVEAKAVTPANGNSVFIMATRDGVPGFYPLSTTNNIIGGHKSYLEIRATNAARLSIVWDDTETGIFEFEGGEQNTEIYDLTGRRLDKPTKGVNVVGGKLVIK